MAGSNINKLATLEEALFASLRDAIDGEDVFTMSVDEDRLAALEAILLRVTLLGRSHSLVDVMEDEEGGQSSGWEIICAFAERAGVGYKEEAKVSNREMMPADFVSDGRVRLADHISSYGLAFQAVRCCRCGG